MRAAATQDKARRQRRGQGFTLIELIASLVILGFLGVFAGYTFTLGARSTLNAKLAEESAQKAQIALARIASELRDLNGGPASSGTAARISATSIAYTSADTRLPGTTLQPRILAYDTEGKRITLTVAGAAYTLVDGVASCTMSADSTYAPTLSVRFTLKESGANFSLTVTPRGVINPPASS
ncbi:MAG: hypothetical protein AUJ49_10160 [Desulfovibrionaceae bacterium CG1_02_65_16]|nr:MAG: hypothetical protein AUJ49_10160 [Desulfovibrionaceae bacterium CG1_02_65_16]